MVPVLLLAGSWKPSTPAPRRRQTEQRGAENCQRPHLRNCCRVPADRLEHREFRGKSCVILTLLIVAGECILNEGIGTAKAAGVAGSYARTPIAEIAPIGDSQPSILIEADNIGHPAINGKI